MSSPFSTFFQTLKAGKKKKEINSNVEITDRFVLTYSARCTVSNKHKFLGDARIDRTENKNKKFLATFYSCTTRVKSLAEWMRPFHARLNIKVV